MTALSPASVAGLRHCTRPLVDYGGRQRSIPAGPEWVLEEVLRIWHQRRLVTPEDRPLIDPDLPEPVVQPVQLDRLLADERARLVRWAVQRLPAVEKRVVWLRYWEEVELACIGQLLGFSASGAGQVHRRALGRLKRIIKNAVWKPPPLGGGGKNAPHKEYQPYAHSGGLP